MKHSITLPAWANQSWFAHQLYPNASPGAARTRLSRKLSGHRAWKESELERLSQIFFNLEGAAFSNEIDKIMDQLFGKIDEE